MREKAARQAVQDSIVVQIAKEAYVYGFPSVVMDITRRQMTNASGKGMIAAPNTFVHLSDFPDASFTNVVRPNVDTYYSSSWLDLSKEPVILSLPDTRGRYYMMPMLDAYTNVFASPGTRTTGNAKGDFLITPPGWTGTIPADMKHIAAPTVAVWLIGRTQVNSRADGEQVVVPLQRQYRLTPLSAWGKPYTPPLPASDPSVPEGFPNAIVERMSADEYFNYVNRLLVAFPPPTADGDALDKFAAIRVGAGKTFDLETFSETVRKAIVRLPADVVAEFGRELSAPKELENGWSVPRAGVGAYGRDYYRRAYAAFVGLGANLPQDAVYRMCSVDADGKQLNGNNMYVVRYEKGLTPPANAFWSLTLYDSKGLLTSNSLDRYAVGDRSNLKTNPDGSVDIYISRVSPGKDKENNWLPAPADDFNLCLRVYALKPAMIDGSWTIAPVKKLL